MRFLKNLGIAVLVCLFVYILISILLPKAKAATVDLTDPVKKEIAMEIVSSAENNTLNWKQNYSYIQDIGDERGYTGGIIGFTSGTGDMLEVVEHYAQGAHSAAGNALVGYLPALRAVNGTASHTGLGDGFVAAWKQASGDPAFQQSQEWQRDRMYFNPGVAQAKADGLHALGQFIYFDAYVTHGPGDSKGSFDYIRNRALALAKTPTQGGTEAGYLNAFLDARTRTMKEDPYWQDTTRIDTAQRLFLNAGNFDLNVPLNWKVYGDSYSITTNPVVGTPTPVPFPAAYPGNPKPAGSYVRLTKSGEHWADFLKLYPVGSTNVKALQQWHKTHGTPLGNPAYVGYYTFGVGARIVLPNSSPGVLT